MIDTDLQVGSEIHNIFIKTFWLVDVNFVREAKLLNSIKNWSLTW